ncbi:VOC family protein [Luteolibacter ambystomatis]|uniref:VOC family protein n=1 Tax=Luteolibacter ambystomatis TaxID=2824561 RepID=A0A975IYB3_9BACT|nr:VOC family protein [Luteolibacter ambystomatis]QUE50057.1 VOC family protein [Luteolibacter ambystomatis]
MSGIGIKEAAFTGYPATDMSAARKFYGEILGLPEGMVFEHEGVVGWVEYSITGGHTLAITQANDQWQPSPNGGGLCFEVEDLDAAVANLDQQGVTIVLPVQEFPVCRLALIADPSGNTIALHQKKPNHPECSC